MNHKLKIDIITLFPDIFSFHSSVLPLNRAQELGVLTLNIINLRGFSSDNYGTVDDKPYGGGKGMILMIEPIYKALESIYGKNLIHKGPDSKIIALTPRGARYDQKKAVQLSELNQITFICGRYEGIDERIIENYVDESISLGDFILAGGEVACMAVVESISRLLPGVLDEKATEEESFSSDYIEYPHYTRPEEFKGHKVPDVLLSGNHSEIEKWRESNKMPYSK